MKLSLLSLAILTGALAAPAPAADPEAFPISEVPSGLSLEEHALSKRQYSSSSYNQLTDGTACRRISVIYARGTGQQGNVGDAAAVGPLFFNQIASRVGGTSALAIQGVTYPANVAGFLAGGDAAGSTTLTNLISTVSTPKSTTLHKQQRLIQNRPLPAAPAPRLSSPATPRALSSSTTPLSAPPQPMPQRLLPVRPSPPLLHYNILLIHPVVVFGDPKRGQSFGSITASKIRTICHTGDNICEGGSSITAAHLNYQQDASTAGAFVAGKV